MRQAERDVTRIFTVAERTPRHELGAFEDLREIARIAKLIKRIHVKHLRTRGGDERSMCGRRHVRHLLEPFDVLRAASKLVIAYEHAVRTAAERPVFFFVNLLELDA